MAYITKRGNKWRAQVRRTGHPSKNESFPTKPLAEAWARKVEAEMDAGKTAAIMPDVSFGELIDKYTEVVGEAKEFGRTKEAALKYLRSELGHFMLSDMDKDMLMAFVQRRISDDGVSGVTVSVDLTYMASVLRAAKHLWDKMVDLGMFEAVRANMAMMNISTRSKHRSRRVSDDELRQIVHYFDTRPLSKINMSDIVHFALATTMRSSEITTLRWDDLNEADRTIIIRSRKHPTDKENNDQLVPLIGASFDIIMRQPRTDERIFPLALGTISSIFPRCTKALGLVDLRFHDLRHEGISRLFDAGFSIEQVSLLSGHKSWQQLKRYTHLSPKQLHSFAAARLNAPTHP